MMGKKMMTVAKNDHTKDNNTHPEKNPETGFGSSCKQNQNRREIGSAQPNSTRAVLKCAAELSPRAERLLFENLFSNHKMNTVRRMNAATPLHCCITHCCINWVKLYQTICVPSTITKGRLHIFLKR
jgi:hypothetical protein